MRMPVHNALIDSLGLIFAIVVVALLIMQWRWPLRRQHFTVVRRWLRNGILAAPSLLISRILLVPIPFLVALWATRENFGLFHWLPAPAWIATVAGVFLYDYAYYWWHKLMHLASFFWRFHNVHHTDLDMDVTTASRFHLGEVLFSIFFRVAVVGLLGLNIWALAIYELLFSLANQFQHSNWRLPIGLERVLNLLFVTPRMHGIHHSIVQRETNSNWGTVFCWWDHLHRTLRLDVPQNAITIGVAAYRDEAELTFGQLFVLPFRKQRPWRLPDGDVPTRAPQSADRLVP
ncbi:MAG: sterol desaturase family protein [Verrucomicrobiota bacterium]|nr:sterol desaturase family protein [Verrucomicrobiota bacterium]